MNIYPVNTKIWFDGERHAYTVRACDDHYLVCTKPYNVKHTVLYTIVDLEEGIRGADDVVCNFIFAKRYFDHDDCDGVITELRAGVRNISNINRVPLKIKRTEWRRDGW